MGTLYGLESRDFYKENVDIMMYNVGSTNLLELF